MPFIILDRNKKMISVKISFLKVYDSFKVQKEERYKKIFLFLWTFI